MKVSIIIPVYNAEKFIVNCIDSILAQTERDWEAIFVNDGSKDKSAEIIGSVDDDRIRVINQENAGPSAARNRGIREAKGDYILFVDADDTITSNCIEMLYSLASDNDSDYVQGTYYNEYQPSETFVLNNKKEIKTLLLDYNKIPYMPHNRLVRRTMIIEHNLFFDKRIRVREDFLWMTFVAKYVNRFTYCHIPTYKREYNEDSLTHNINLERERLGYRVLLETMCDNFDAFLIGEQRVLALDVLYMIIQNRLYTDNKEKKHLIAVVYNSQTWWQKPFFKFYMSVSNHYMNVKIHHLLNRLYII